MKLSKVTSNDPIGRQALSFHQSTTRQLQAYRKYYQSVYGDEITMSELVEEIAKRFLKDDREFVKFFAKNPGAGDGAPVAQVESVAPITPVPAAPAVAGKK